MQPIEIVIIIFAISVVCLVFGRIIWKKCHGLPTGECEECHQRIKMAVKKMKKDLKKK